LASAPPPFVTTTPRNLLEDHEELREEDFTLRTLENSEEQQPLNNNTQVKNSYDSVFKKNIQTSLFLEKH